MTRPECADDELFARCDCIDRVGVFAGDTCGCVLIAAEYDGGDASETLSAMAFADLLR